MDPYKYFNGHSLKNRGRKQNFEYARKYAIRWETFAIVLDKDFG